MNPLGGPEFILLTGPLGSGKTTLLLDFLATPGAAGTGVIVNEAGAIDVDGAVLSIGTNGLPLAHLPNGCICCSQGDDLLSAIDALIAERATNGLTPFRRLVLECSGLAYPGPILRSLSNLRHQTFRTRILSTFDAFGACTDNAMVPIVAAQLAAAQAVVITKTEIADVDTIGRAVSAVASYNPLLEPIVFSDRAARIASAFSPGPTARVSRFLADQPASHPRISVIQVDCTAPATWPSISDWLDNLVDTLGGRLLRVKGFIEIEGCPDPLLIESVGTTFSTPRRVAGHVGPARGLIIIARDTNAEELNGLPEAAVAGLSVRMSSDVATKLQ